MRMLIAAICAAVFSVTSTLAAEGTVDEEVAKIEALAAAARASDVDADVLSVFEADLEFAVDARKRHVSDAFADRFLVDGKMFPGGRPIVVGPDSVRASLKDSKAEWYWAPVEGKVDGDIGVTWGRAFIVTRGEDGAEDRTYRGRYVTVWSRDDDGDWKVWLDLGTSASPEE